MKEYVYFFALLTWSALGILFGKILVHHDIFWNVAVKILFERYYVINEYDQLPSDGFIICSNHLSWTDWIVYRSIFNNCFSIVKSDLLETEYRLLKSLSKHIFSQFDLLPYKRRDVQSGIEIKRIVVDLVQKNKKNVLFFPEGTTSLNILDGMKPLKKGGFAHFYENNIPIVPCIIKYSNDFYGLTIEKQVRLLDLFIERPNVFVYCLNVVYPKDFSTYEGFFDCIQKNMEKKINKIK